MSGFTYRPEVEAEILAGSALVDVLEAYAVGGAQGARRLGPAPVSHHYERSISGGVVVTPKGPIGRVQSDDIAAHLIEFGSVNNPAYAPLRNGVESTGLRVTDRGKRS